MTDLYPADEEINYTENAPTPVDEGRVNWHLRKRNEAARKAEATKALFAAEIAELQLRCNEVLQPLKSAIEWNEFAIEGWHRAMYADKKVGLTVKLPHGTSKLGNIGKSLEIKDQDSVRAWVESLDNAAALLTKPEPALAKGEIKKFLKVSPTANEEPGAELELVNPETGEVVKGLTIKCGVRNHTAS